MLLALPTPPALAQMPGLPVLQNAFSNPGITVALNYGDGHDAKSFGGALAWAPSNGRFQVSGGVGALDPRQAGRSSTWGGRLAVPVTQSLMGGKLGVAAFAGVGGAAPDDGTVTHVPAGIGLGYRLALLGRGVSVYAAPFFSWTRVRAAGVTSSGGVFRISGGLDFALLPSLGVTVGVEGGSKARTEDPGPTGTLFGAGISYALRRSR